MKVSGHWDSNPEPCADLALTPLIRRLLYRLSYAPGNLVAVEGIEPTSLDYQSSALPLSYTANISLFLAAVTRFELVSTRLQDECSGAN
jgi:hypothetical protein